jgi:soluble lytic murein transglycosylase-like protein
MDYTTMILGIAKIVKVPGALLLAVCMHETGLVNVKVSSDGGSPTFGICQIKSGSAELVGYKGSPEELMNPKTNVLYAAKYLKYQINRYDGDLCKATAAYNAGSYTESRIEPGYPRNLKYVRGVQRKLASNMKPKLSCNGRKT